MKVKKSDQNNTEGKSRAKAIANTALNDYIKSNPSATLEKIAKRFSVPLSTIRKRILEFKIPYRPKNITTMTDELLASFIAEHPELARSEIASHFKVATSTIQKHIEISKIPYQLKKPKTSKVSLAIFLHYANKHPSATDEELAKYFDVRVPTIQLWKRKCLPLVNETSLAEYIAEYPNTNWQTLKKYFPGISIREHLPNGIPRQWTRETVENLLNELVPRLEDALTTTMHKAKYLHRAFLKFGLDKNYPLHYWRFDPMIYQLFGMDIPKDYEEELRMEWPPREVLHKRYRELLKLHHPDRYHDNPQAAKVAHFKLRWIVKAYGHLIKRRKRLTVSEPPVSIIRSTEKNNGKLIAT